MIRKWGVHERGSGVPIRVLCFTLSGAKRKAARLNTLAERYGLAVRLEAGLSKWDTWGWKR